MVAQDKLISSRYRYSIVNDVPFLLPESPIGESKNREPSRSNFYSHHYSKRSRDVDVASGYLSFERRFVSNIIKCQQISGLVLEVGCGTGIFAECSTNYLGMDYSSTSVFALGFEPYRRFVGDAQAIPLATGTVQLVFSYNTLEHVPRPDTAFEEIDRVLQPAGYAVLHPAWNCTYVQTRLIPVLPYARLAWYDRLTKAALSLLRSKSFKFITRTCYRVWRHLTTCMDVTAPLRYRALQPYLGDEYFISDCDATANIDVFDGILFFQQRGYRCISHPKLWQKIAARHSAVVLQKPD